MKRVLGFFGGHRRRCVAKSSVHGDRRSTYRYTTVDNDAQLGWWVGEDFHTRSARIRDISQSGVLVESEDLPPASGVFLRMVRPGETDWAPLTVLREAVTSTGTHLLGTRFTESCPYELFKKSRGYRLEGRTAVGSPHFDARYWR